jgi:hypothetical protein
MVISVGSLSELHDSHSQVNLSMRNISTAICLGLILKGDFQTFLPAGVRRCLLAQAKIELKLGNFQFTGEAEAAWLEKQLDKLLEHVKSVEPADSSEDSHDDQTATGKHKNAKTLSAYLKAAGATKNQVKKFLATACWLMGKGSKRLATAEVTKALSDNHQGKLTNPAACLNNNVTKGFCEKEGKQFYVTEEGFNSLGGTIE